MLYQPFCLLVFVHTPLTALVLIISGPQIRSTLPVCDFCLVRFFVRISISLHTFVWCRVIWRQSNARCIRHDRHRTTSDVLEWEGWTYIWVPHIKHAHCVLLSFLKPAGYHAEKHPGPKKTQPGPDGSNWLWVALYALFVLYPLHRIEFGPPKFKFSILFYSTLQISGGGHFQKACRSR